MTIFSDKMRILTAAAILLGTFARAGEPPNVRPMEAGLIRAERVVTLTDGTVLRGIVVFSAERGTILLINGEERFIPRDKIRSVAKTPEGGKPEPLVTDTVPVGVDRGEYFLGADDPVMVEEGVEAPARPPRPQAPRQSTSPPPFQAAPGTGGSSQVLPPPRTEPEPRDEERTINYSGVDGRSDSSNDDDDTDGPSETDTQPSFGLPPPSTTGYVGRNFYYKVDTNITPATFTSTELPPGLKLDGATGKITGVPTEAGVWQVTVTAAGDGVTDIIPLTLTILIPPPPEITGPEEAIAIHARYFSVQIEATNQPTSYTATDLPAGLSVNTATGVISGTCYETTTATVTITAANAGGKDTETFTLSVQYLRVQIKNEDGVFVDVENEEILFDENFVLRTTYSPEVSTFQWSTRIDDDIAWRLTGATQAPSGTMRMEHGPHTDISTFAKDTKLRIAYTDPEGDPIAEEFYVVVVPWVANELSVARHPDLATPKDIQAHFTDDGLLVREDDDDLTYQVQAAATEGEHTGVIQHTVTSADPGYDDIEVDDVTAEIVDLTWTAPAPAVLVTESSGNTIVVENGVTDTYTVVLTAQPVDDVTVTIPDPTPVNQITVNPSVLTFTPDNWSTLQTVTVTAVDDTDPEGPHDAVITHAVSSNDISFSNFEVEEVIVTVLDAGPPLVDPGVTITETGGVTYVVEGGMTDSYTLALDDKPNDDVTITLVSPTADGQLTVNPTTLTFTDANWNTPQTVTVTAIDPNAAAKADMEADDDKDDVPLKTTFTITDVGLFPDQSDDSFPEEERFNYTEPFYNDIPDDITADELLAGTFAHITQVQSGQSGKFGGSYSGLAYTPGSRIIFTQSMHEATAMHEWMHNCDVSHRSDNVVDPPEDPWGEFDPYDSDAPYIISYGTDVNEINRAERKKMLDWVPAAGHGLSPSFAPDISSSDDLKLPPLPRP